MNRSAAVPGLNREDVYRLSVHLPKLEEQRRIAAILDHADALRSKQSEILSRIGQLPQALYLEAFGDPAENPRGFPRVPLRALAVKMSDGPFGSNLKTEHYVDEGVPVVRLQNIGVGAYLPDNKAFIAESHFLRLRKHECHPGDLLIGTLGDPNLRACLQPSYLPRALNKADCVQLRVDEAGADPRWVMWMLNMPGTLILASALVLGQTRSRIAMGRLRELEVPVPPLEQQRLFGRRVARVEQLRDEAVRADRASGELFASLQTRAFRGEL